MEGEELAVDLGAVWYVANVTSDWEKIEESKWTIVESKNKNKKKPHVMQEEVVINQIRNKGWESGGKAEVTIDKAAEESVCPKDWGDMFELIDVEAGKEMKLRNANGGKIEH